MSSFERPGSAVFGLSCSVFISSHAPGSASSGNFRKNWGTKPSVLPMSARAAAAAGLALAAPSARALAEAPSRTRATETFTSLILRFMSFSFVRVGFGLSIPVSEQTRRRDLRRNGTFRGRSARAPARSAGPLWLAGRREDDLGRHLVAGAAAERVDRREVGRADVVAHGRREALPRERDGATLEHGAAGFVGRGPAQHERNALLYDVAQAGAREGEAERARHAEREEERTDLALDARV